MTSIAIGSSEHLSTDLMKSMLDFRYEVFVKRLAWQLPMIGGTESDLYDTADARYVVISNDSHKVTGCARLLRTTGAYMLPELFPQLLGGLAAPHDEATWELSRFATSITESREGRALSLSKSTMDLLDVVFHAARQNDATRLILVTSIGIERLMLRSGLDAHRLGPPASIDGALCVALMIEVPRQKSASVSDGDTAPKRGTETCASKGLLAQIIDAGSAICQMASSDCPAPAI
jgi:N-acyl-L-homoserine lactone synthetase